MTDYEATGGLAGLRPALEMTSQQIVTEVTDSGLRGRGGAGFPAGIKWQTVLDTAADQKFIACNTDEGDSGTFADRMLMEGDPFVLVEGMVIAGLAVDVTEGYIYVRSEYPDAIATMSAAIDIAYLNGWMNPSGARGMVRALTCTSALGPGRTYAARRPRCSRASRADAG